MDRMRIDRRRALQLGAGGLLVGPAGMAFGQPEPPTAKPGRGIARNVIVLVSDGMSTGTLTLAHLVRDIRGLGPSHWYRLWERPDVRRAMCETRSADGWVTDSAAAGSAWGIGVKVNNRSINVTPDGATPEPILATAKSIGKATGLVTTTRLTHATPASFIATVPHRVLEGAIATQMLERGVDIMLGGGAKHFPPALVNDETDITVVRSSDELTQASGGRGRLLGLFADDHMPFACDRPSTTPSLQAMTRAALDRLERSTEGFVLQVEAGRVDHAAHENDGIGLVADQIEFDDTIAVVEAWTRDRNDTLVIVTTDHANANPGLTYYGRRGVESLEALARGTRSFEWIVQEAARRGDGLEGLVASIAEATGVTLTDDEQGLLGRSWIERAPINAFNIANGRGPALGSILANHTGVAFLSPNHTADAVELTAYGPGSERLPALIDNTDVHRMMLAALDPRFEPAWR